MYTPKPFEITDQAEAASFMQRYSFATLINVVNGIPSATHLPFVVKHSENTIILSSHLANPNQQSIDMFKGVSLVIFAEPHAYIAPKHYEKQLNVPTWNYVAIHAYGNAEIVSDETEKLDALKEMIAVYDDEYLKQWADIPADYKLKLLKAITVFNIKVTDLQGKSKLSQNRNEQDRRSIINAFSKSADTNERIIGNMMQREMKK